MPPERKIQSGEKTKTDPNAYGTTEEINNASKINNILNIIGQTNPDIKTEALKKNK